MDCIVLAGLDRIASYCIVLAGSGNIGFYALVGNCLDGTDETDVLNRVLVGRG